MQAATHSPSSGQRPEEHPQTWPDLRVSPWAVDTPAAPAAQAQGRSSCTATTVPLRGWIQPRWHITDTGRFFHLLRMQGRSVQLPALARPDVGDSKKMQPPHSLFTLYRAAVSCQGLKPDPVSVTHLVPGSP